MNLARFIHPRDIDITNHALIKSKTTDEVFSNIRRNNSSNFIFVYLNINGKRNKFDDLRHIINGYIGFLSNAETKIDASFPFAQVALEGYHLVVYFSM